MKRLIIFGGIAIVIIGGVFVLLLTQRNVTIEPNKVSLTMWGVFDDDSYYTDIIRAYTAQHPYVSIEYKKYRFEEYEDMLISSWARGVGPDIFLIPNYWLGKYKDFVTPLPKSTKMYYYSTVKTLGIKEDVKIEQKDEPSVSLTSLKNNYVDTVFSDVVIANQAYAFPLSIDTLILFYNKDLLSRAGYPLPPKTWAEFVSAVTKLTILDNQGNVVQSGAALGTYDNVPRAFDILSLLMLQNGTLMTAGSKVTFEAPSPSDPSYFPGEEALRFYTDFASPTKEVYSWNSAMPNALENFSQGNLAFFFGYAFHIPLIDQRSKGINYGISFFPQISPTQEMNYANYWVATVAKASSHANEAWNFIQFAGAEKNVGSYLTKAGRVSPLRTLLTQQLTNPESNVYILAKQALTAKSWYHGSDPNKTEKQFKAMIDNVVNGTMTTRDALKFAAQVIEQTL